MFYMDDSYLPNNGTITSEILKDSGFTHYILDNFFEISINNEYFIHIEKGYSNIDVENNWVVHIDDYAHCSIGSADIRTIKQFNTLMDVFNIHFKLKN